MDDILHGAQLFHAASVFVVHHLSTFGVRPKGNLYLKFSQFLIYITIISIEKGLYHYFPRPLDKLYMLVNKGLYIVVLQNPKFPITQKSFL